jgi:hypothetical protein
LTLNFPKFEINDCCCLLHETTLPSFPRSLEQYPCNLPLMKLF